MRSPRQFIKLYLSIIILCFILPLVFSYLILERSGENQSFSEIIHNQQTHDAIYGSALTDNAYVYKLKLLQQTKPDVIALGSSRVLQFREEFFKSSFVNAGLAMRSLHEGRVFLNELLKFHQPKVVILGVDFWWFREDGHAADEDDLALSQASIMPERFSVPKLIKPLHFLIKKKLTLSEVEHILLTPDQPNSVTRFENIGIPAMAGAYGFRKDGSNFYSGQIFGLEKKFYDAHFKNALKRVRTGTARFGFGQTLSPQKVQEFYEIIKLCQQHHIQLVVFIPPLAEPVYQAMMAKQHHEYDYIAAYRKLVAVLPVEHYDYFEANRIHSGDCEFDDGYHGGDVTYARILLTMLQDNPHSAIARFVDRPVLNQAVQNYSGFAMIPFHPELYPRPEVDFLQLGCPKRTAQPKI